MKAREMRNETNMHIFPKDILNKTFLFDDNVNIKKIRVDNKREDNIRYLLKIIFDGNGRLLCLTKRALDDLLGATGNYSGVVVTVRYGGKSGEKKGTHWLFSVVNDKQQNKHDFSISSAM
jgi:hypothetical protein